jgi:hypothetical protein
MATKVKLEWIQQNRPKGVMFTRGGLPAVYTMAGERGGIPSKVVLEGAGRRIVKRTPFQEDLDMIEERLRALAERLRESYDPQYADTMLEEVNAGEPEVALEILLAQLDDDEVSVDPELIDEMESLGRLLELSPQRWEVLRGSTPNNP